jgi:hypothetical protein
MGLIDSWRTWLRSFKGAEELERQVPRRSRKPRIGTPIVHVREGLRMVVQAGMSDELWLWLMDQGWRVEHHRPDRREYREIPVSFVTRLIDADPRFREKMLYEAVMGAQQRAALTRSARKDTLR